MYVASVYDENCEKIKEFSSDGLIFEENKWNLQKLGYKACECVEHNDDFLEKSVEELVFWCNEYNLGY